MGRRSRCCKGREAGNDCTLGRLCTWGKFSFDCAHRVSRADDAGVAELHRSRPQPPARVFFCVVLFRSMSASPDPIESAEHSGAQRVWGSRRAQQFPLLFSGGHA